MGAEGVGNTPAQFTAFIGRKSEMGHGGERRRALKVE